MKREEFYFVIRTLYESYDERIDSIDKELIKKLICNFRPFDDNFMVLVPSEPLGNSRYLQMAPSREIEGLEVETRFYFSNSEDDFKHYRKSFSFSVKDLEHIDTVFCDYLDKNVIDVTLWDEVTKEFK